MRGIKDLKNIKGKTALVRVDFNVPILAGKVQDDFRIKKSLETIKFLLKKGAKVILITHLGKDGSASLDPVIKHFYKIAKLTEKEKNQIEFYENIRRLPGEEKNDPSFARGLSRQADFYVNEAFSVSHRMHGSIVGLPKFLPSYAGFNLEEEVKNLSKALKPSHPFLFILGGAKFSTKMPLIKKYLKLADHIFIGGALLNDFLVAEGDEVGKSLVDRENYGIDKLLKNKNLIIPEYVLVQEATGKFVEKNVKEINKTDVIVDVGEKSLVKLAELIKKSKMILWNGPLGKYENGGDKATKKVLKMIASSKAESIIGGGDTEELIHELKLEKKFSFVSTGGGATLEFLAEGNLVGIKALK